MVFCAWILQSSASYRLKYIAKKEKVSITDDALKCLIDTSDGDMRRAVTSLQSAARYAAREKQLTAEDAAELCGVSAVILFNL